MIRRRLSLTLLTLTGLLLFPLTAFGSESEFKPVDEFINTYWTSFSLGPVEIGISKAVDWPRRWLAPPQPSAGSQRNQ